MENVRYDVAVIGAGQAGLAIGHALAEQKKRFVILEAADSVGSAWRNRWDSLVLFTPRRYDALPGLAFPGDPDGYPTRDEVAAYLARYVERFGLPVELSTPVRSLSKDADGFVVDANGTRDSRGRGRGCDRAVPRADRAGHRRRSGGRGLPDAQRRLPSAGGPAGRPCPGGGWRQHRLPDRERARRQPRGSPRDRLAAEALAAASARSRPLLVADEARRAVEVRRFPDRPARARPRRPDRVEPARCQAPWRRRAVARGRRGRPHGPVRRRHRARYRRGDLGDGLQTRPLVDRPADQRRRRPPTPSPRGQRRSRALLPRSVLATHARLRTARIRRRRRGVHRRSDRRRPRGSERRSTGPHPAR